MDLSKSYSVTVLIITVQTKIEISIDITYMISLNSSLKLALNSKVPRQYFSNRPEKQIVSISDGKLLKQDNLTAQDVFQPIPGFIAFIVSEELL